MMKTKIALAVLLASFALAPASAKTTKPAKGKAKATKVVKAKTNKSKAPVKKGAKKAAVATAAAATAATAVAATPTASASEKRLDRRFDSMSMQYLTALWRVDPEGGN